MNNNKFDDGRWSITRIVVATLAFMLGSYILGFLVTGGDLAFYKFWAPKQEAARRMVYEQTPSYVEGKISYINLMRLQYETAEGAQKKALRTAILSEAINVDNTLLPIELRMFLNSIKREQ